MHMTHDPTTNGPRKRRDRPFPWRCFHCLKEEVYPATIPYAAEVKHDGRLHHVEIPKLTIPKCRACGELVFNHSADDQILHALRLHLRLLTPEQIKAGRKALGLKSKELAKRLGVADATVSRWEQKRLIQSRAMDNLLRVFFAVQQVRDALRGEEQDPGLGVTAVPAADPPVPQTPRSVLVAAFRTTEVRERVKRSAAPVHWHPFPVGAN
jgi:putative zinc finger/helix-turn-helix YgiT family protein